MVRGKQCTEGIRREGGGWLKQTEWGIKVFQQGGFKKWRSAENRVWGYRGEQKYGFGDTEASKEGDLWYRVEQTEVWGNRGEHTMGMGYRGEQTGGLRYRGKWKIVFSVQR